MRERAHWERIAWRHEALVETSTGRVVGRVIGEWRTWAAHADIRPLGDYVTMEQAKAAVESAQRLTHVVYDAK